MGAQLTAQGRPSSIHTARSRRTPLQHICYPQSPSSFFLTAQACVGEFE